MFCRATEIQWAAGGADLIQVSGAADCLIVIFKSLDRYYSSELGSKFAAYSSCCCYFDSWRLQSGRQITAARQDLSCSDYYGCCTCCCGSGARFCSFDRNRPSIVGVRPQNDDLIFGSV